MDTSRKIIWITATGVAFVTSNISAQTVSQPQPLLRPPPDSLPPPVAQISKITLGQVQGWVNRVKILKPSFKPSDDPDYSEFWIEMRPAQAGDTTLPPPMSLSKPLSGQLLLNSSPHDSSRKVTKTPDLSKYLKGKSKNKNIVFTDWSEEAFGEIGPDYAEIAGPDDLRMNKSKKKPNMRVSVRAVDAGKKVSAEYYQQILSEIEKSASRK